MSEERQTERSDREVAFAAIQEWRQKYAELSYAAHRAMDALGVPWTDDVLERLTWLGNMPVTRTVGTEVRR